MLVRLLLEKSYKIKQIFPGTSSQNIQLWVWNELFQTTQLLSEIIQYKSMQLRLLF